MVFWGKKKKNFPLIYIFRYGYAYHYASEDTGGTPMYWTISGAFHTKLRHFLCRKSYQHFHGVQIDDIVIAESSTNPNLICVRILGLQGDKILINSPPDFFTSHDYVPTGHAFVTVFLSKGSLDIPCP
uniref:Uncharacterized protein n=1 Tax=Canis lupus familiaris TaxID=9615 RepID=A0A8C0PC79_CANLF